MDNLDTRIALENIVSDVGSGLMSYLYQIRHSNRNIGELVDSYAYTKTREQLDVHLPEFSGVLVSEYKGAEPIQGRGDVSGIAVLDEVDGTRACKRKVMNGLITENLGPSSSIVLGICKEDNLGSVFAGAVYFMRSGIVLSGALEGDSYRAYCIEPGKKSVIDPKHFDGKNRADDEYTIMVIDYSSNMQKEIGEIKSAIMKHSDEENTFKTYGGTHPTTVDIGEEIILTQKRDAYVDPRAMWGEEKGTMLYTHDIVGLLPVIWGAGLETSDIHGNPIEDFPVTGDRPLTLIVARNGLKDKIVEAIAPVIG